MAPIGSMMLTPHVAYRMHCLRRLRAPMPMPSVPRILPNDTLNQNTETARTLL